MDENIAIAPDPAWGAYDAPPDPLVGWGGGCPLPITHSLDARSRLEPIWTPLPQLLKAGAAPAVT